MTLEELSKLSEGLTYMSETDAPFEPFSWETTATELTAKDVRLILALPASTDIITESFDEFLLPSTEIHDWFDEEANTQAILFQELMQSMKHNLTHLQVFKIHQVDIDVYLVGKTLQGNWVGLKTFVVET